MSDNRKCSRGFTLIELVLAMTIVSLVVLLVFSSLSYGNTAFKVSASQNSTQSEVRIASDYVTRTMRFATYVSLSPDVLDSSNVTDPLDYLYIDGGSLIHSAFNGGVNPRIVRTLATGLQENSFFWSRFDIASRSQLVGLSLFGVENRRHFDLQTAIELPNLVLRRAIIIPDVPYAKTITFEKHYTVDPPTPPPLPTHFAVSVSASPSGGGDVHLTDAVEPELGFALGEIATVTATPLAPYTFGAWVEGDVVVSTTPQFSFSVNRNRNLRANFNLVDPTTPLRNVTVVISKEGKNAKLTVKIGDYPAVSNGNDQKEAPYVITVTGIQGGTKEAPNVYPISVTRNNGSVVYSGFVTVPDDDVEAYVD